MAREMSVKVIRIFLLNKAGIFIGKLAAIAHC
jgi:hypothetical protein